MSIVGASNAAERLHETDKLVAQLLVVVNNERRLVDVAADFLSRGFCPEIQYIKGGYHLREISMCRLLGEGSNEWAQCKAGLIKAA